MATSEFDEAYGDDEKHVQGAILTEPLSALKPGPAITVPASATVKSVVELLQSRHIGCVLVVGDDEKLVGIFTERDLLNRVVGRQLDFGRIYVRDFMTPNPEALHVDAKIAWALNKMHIGGYRHLPLVGPDHRPVGVVSVKDIVDFIVELFPAAVLNLPPEPDKEARAQDGG
jgi:CBS domain-containing protein